MSPFKSPYLPKITIQNVLKDLLVKSMMSLDVCKMKVYSSRKNRFLKVVWKISNLNKSRRLVYKIRNFLTSGFEKYATWVECLVKKVVTDPWCE